MLEKSTTVLEGTSAASYQILDQCLWRSEVILAVYAFMHTGINLRQKKHWY